MGRGLITALRANQGFNERAPRVLQGSIRNVSCVFLTKLSSSNVNREEDITCANATLGVSSTVSKQTEKRFFNRVWNLSWPCGGFAVLEQSVNYFVRVEPGGFVIIITRAKASIGINAEGG